MDRLEEMLAAQRELQQLINGYELSEQDNELRIANIKENVLALTAELYAEVLGEIGWKSWATSRHVNEDALKKELVDVWHFFMNLLLHAGMTADDLYEGYLKKREINVRRQLESYDGVSTKCPNCGRALEDIVIHQVHGALSSEVLYFCECSAGLSPDIVRPFLAD